MPKLTKTKLQRALSPAGRLRPAQFRALGFKGPFKGWKQSLVGLSFTNKQLDEFVGLRKATKNKRCVTKPKSKKKKASTLPIPEKYSECLKDPRWIRKRKRILIRDDYKCVYCDGRVDEIWELHVHHLLYDNAIAIWDVPDFYLVTLCDVCHKEEHSKNLSPPKKHF